MWTCAASAFRTRKLRPEIKLINGRWFRPGKYEIVVGKSAQDQFAGLKVGDHVALPSGDWLVTGTFESNGSANESELITDVSTLLSAMRTSAYNSMTVRLTSPAAFTQFKNAITSRPGPALEISRESDFLCRQSKSFDQFSENHRLCGGRHHGTGRHLRGAEHHVFGDCLARA